MVHLLVPFFGFCGGVGVRNASAAERNGMAGGRNHNIMKLIGFHVTKQFKAKLDREAKRQGVSRANYIRSVLKRELGEKKEIGSQIGLK